jgi:hypothetical protein
MPAPVDELAPNTRVSDLEIFDFDNSESTNPLHTNASRLDLQSTSSEEYNRSHRSLIGNVGDNVIRASSSVSIDCLYEDMKNQKKQPPQHGLVNSDSLSLDPSLLPSALNCFNPKADLNLNKDVEFLSEGLFTVPSCFSKLPTRTFLYLSSLLIFVSAVVSKERAELFPGQTKFGVEPSVEELLEALRTLEGIPESNSEVTKWKLKLRLRSHFSRGETLDTFVEKELESFFR